MNVEKQVQKLQKRHLREDEMTWQDGIKLVMSTQQGRRMVWLFLAECGVFRNPATANALSTQFACGEMNVGQRLLARITELAPDAFLVMQKESIDVGHTRTTDAATIAERDTASYSDPTGTTTG